MLRNSLEKATFAGGCFWCMVKPFAHYEGVKEVVSGYIGGDVPNPTYEQVCQENTGHVEAVQITFDSKIISYQQLLELYWQQIDPTDGQGQFADRGTSYRPVIFYHSEAQKQQALASKKQLAQSGRFSESIEVEILPASTFYLAEEHHQDFYQKQPEHYQRYNQGSGRAIFIKKHWGEKPK